MLKVTANILKPGVKIPDKQTLGFKIFVIV